MDMNVVEESAELDKTGKYIKEHCPELKDVPLVYIHEPWRIPKDK